MSASDPSSSLLASRNPDGGFGPLVGLASEPEPTALVALAFDDEVARAWLLSAQNEDGSVTLEVGPAVRDVTALAALAMPEGAQRERALDRVVGLVGHNGPDPAVRALGWPWTDGTHGWTEPTAWGLLALRTLRPDASERIRDALAMFAERECVGGGWNYGSRVTLGVDLRPYVQTTGLALLALGATSPGLTDRGLDRLASDWRSEAAGTLSLAVTCTAMRAFGDPRGSDPLQTLLATMRPGEPDTVIACWQRFAVAPTDPWGVT